MDNAKLMLLQRKGEAHVSGKIYALIGALIVIVLTTSLAPSFFSGLGTRTGLGNTTLNPDSPTWLPTIMIVIVAAGLVFLVWRVFEGK